MEIINTMLRESREGKLVPQRPVIGEKEAVLKLYNERLIAKLHEKRIELEKEIEVRKATEQALRESQNQLQLVVSASNIGFYDWKPVTNELYLSLEWKSQLGYEEDEISNRYEEWEKRLHPDDKERVIKTLHESLNPPWPVYETEFRMKHKDGAYRWIYTRGEVLRDENDRPVRVLGCHIDITERKKMEEDILERVRELENFYQMAVGRELRMKELKEEIQELREELGKMKKT